MNKFKEMMRDSTFIRWSFFILFNAVLLYIMFSVIKNLGYISEQAIKIINTITEAFWPLILGLILAYLLNPLSELIDNKLVAKLIKLPDDPIKAEKREGLRRLISVLFTVILVIAAIIALMYGFTVLLIGKV
ncbi:MAG: hypothetical protein IJB14_01965, partial [Firmicutes bacterium]|nr:hypothetical protein [Bacillota bacterium]